MAANVSVKSIKKETNDTTLELQKYIDTFHKELEENDDALIEISQLEDGKENEDAGTYFVDEDGQFYFQPSNVENVIEYADNDAGDAAILPGQEENFEDGQTGQEELSYVYIVQDDEQADSERMAENDTKITVYDFQDEENSAEPLEVEPEPEDDKSQIIKMKGAGNTTGKVYQCPFCEYSNTRRFLLSRHVKIHSDERPYKCSVCAKGFRSTVALTNHENTHTGTRPHGCDQCEAAFATTGELHRHMRYRHTMVRPHKCGECDYAAVEYSKLRRHQRCHSGERPYQCPHCTYASPDTFKLKRHIRVHTGERPYPCDLCSAAFSQSNSLKAHRLTHYPDRKPTFQCALCPAKCGRKADLRGHIRKLHTATEPLECKRCGKHLPDRYSYKVHVRTHDGEKSYKCDICPYASISQLHLASHMLIHTNEKPFSCNLCDQKFRQKQLLKRHQNLYHNPNYVPPKPRPKNHECEECGRKFIHQGNLIRHLAMHDPDSNVHEENMALKIGRKQKVKNLDDMDEATEIILKGEDGSDEDGRYVVFEMIQLEEDGQETVRIVNSMETVEDRKPAVKEAVNTKLDMENCFGFDEDEEDDENLLIGVHERDYEDDDDDDYEDCDEDNVIINNGDNEGADNDN